MDEHYQDHPEEEYYYGVRSNRSEQNLPPPVRPYERPRDPKPRHWFWKNFMDEQNYPDHPGEEHYYETRSNRSEQNLPSTVRSYERPPGPKPRRWFLPIALVVLLVFIVVVGVIQLIPKFFPSCTTRSSSPVKLTMYYDTEKQDWIKDVVVDFNSRKMVACDGPITVNAIGLNPGETMQGILNGQ